jgi:hypothetical protein
MAHTRLIHPDHLERLLLALAIATVWCHELGEHVLEQGESCWRQIDPGPERELSSFNLACVGSSVASMSCSTPCLAFMRAYPICASILSSGRDHNFCKGIRFIAQSISRR